MILPFNLDVYLYKYYDLLYHIEIEKEIIFARVIQFLVKRTPVE